MAQSLLKNQSVKRSAIFVLVAVFMALGVLNTIQADGQRLLNRSLKLNNNQAGKTALYSFGFQPPSLGVIQTILFEVCANDPYPGKPCVPPVGFDASAATLVSQTGDVGFSMSPQSTANRMVIERSPFASDGVPNSYVFDNVVNPSNDGSYYVRIQTFPDGDMNGVANYYGGIAFAITRLVTINAVVPPYLLFCVGITISGYDCENVDGNYVNFGEFGSRQASQGDTQMLAASNAKDGYNIRILGNTLTSGTNAIPAITSNDISRPGVSQFGLNLRANSSPQGGIDVTGFGTGLPSANYSQINFYRFNSGDIVASSTAPDKARKFTATYVVNIQKDQAPGVYVSTLTYIALGNF